MKTFQDYMIDDVTDVRDGRVKERKPKPPDLRSGSAVPDRDQLHSMMYQGEAYRRKDGYVNNNGRGHSARRRITYGVRANH